MSQGLSCGILDSPLALHRRLYHSEVRPQMHFFRVDDIAVARDEAGGPWFAACIASVWLATTTL